MKKFLSTILAVVMVLSSMAMVVSANDADYAEGYYYVNGEQYTDFMAAVSAANGGTVIVSGECEFGSRLAVNSSVTLQGVNNATIVPTATYGDSTSETNKKGLLNIAGENVVVNDITFDGSIYGDSLAAPSTFDFKVLRITSGNTTLNNVTIEGSKRALLMVGTSSSTASVEANNLTIIGEGKNLVESGTYADVELSSGSELTINGGSIENACVLGASDSLTVSIDGLYAFADGSNMIYTTAEYIADTYLNNSISNTVASRYVSVLTNNHGTTAEMVEDIVNANDVELANTYIQMIDDMLGRKISFIFWETDLVSGDDRTALEGYRADLETVSAE